MTSYPPRDLASPKDDEAASAVSHPSPEEENLVVEAQGGSIEAFNRLVRLHEARALHLTPTSGLPTDVPTDPEYALVHGPDLFAFARR